MNFLPFSVQMFAGHLSTLWENFLFFSSHVPSITLHIERGRSRCVRHRKWETEQREIGPWRKERERFGREGWDRGEKRHQAKETMLSVGLSRPLRRKNFWCFNNPSVWEPGKNQCFRNTEQFVLWKEHLLSEMKHCWVLDGWPMQVLGAKEKGGEKMCQLGFEWKNSWSSRKYLYIWTNVSWLGPN